MHAVILAGGKGVRLRPYTTTVPKALVPIGDRYTVLEILMRQLAAFGFGRVTLALGHLSEVICAYVGDGRRWGLDIDFAVEEGPLGTAGPLVAIKHRLAENFLAICGDVLTSLDFGALLKRHCGNPSPLTIATSVRHLTIDFGVLTTRSNGEITEFREKPLVDFLVSMGVYGINRELLDRYTPGQYLAFDQVVVDLLEAGTPPFSYEFDGYWLDIGRPFEYDKANAEFALHRQMLLGAESKNS